MPLGEDPFQPLLHATLKANYNPGITQPDLEGSPEQAITSPLHFYDRHIGSNHVLKNVVYLPSIPHLLSTTCDNAILDFMNSDHKFTSTNYNFQLEMSPVKFVDSDTVGWYYFDNVGAISQAYASKLCLHPHIDTWNYMFNVSFGGRHDTPFMSEGFMCIAEHPRGQVDFKTEQMERGLSDSTKRTLREILEKNPRLATWHIFPMIGTFTAIFHNVVKDTKFIWETSRTQGYQIKTRAVPPPDSKSLSKKLKARSFSRGKEAFLDRKYVPKARKFVTVLRAPVRAAYRPDFRHYLQHAWATAAIHNSTYIILHCGRYERIGIRHRDSQTIYLSGVIDTINIKDPHYRKLHVGLHIAIVQDILERKKLAEDLEKISPNKVKKRPADGLEDKETPKSKRRRRASSPHERARAPKLISKELVHRKMALVTLDYDAFSSPVPSSFIRHGESCMRENSSKDTDWTKDPDEQKRFNGQEYFTLKLLAPLGHGAVGVVHPAQAEVTLESGEVLKENLVFKLAFNDEQQERLKNEFEAYCLMSREDGIEGIVDVHGLFHDPESGVMGMLMGDGGTSLRRRESQRIGKEAEQVTTTRQERKAFVSALKSIHKADIRHGDMRPDNLTINSDGQVFIIDFDCAEWPEADEALAAELKRLNDVLDGKFNRY